MLSGGNSSIESTGSISGVYAASTRNIYGFNIRALQPFRMFVLRVLFVLLGVLYYSSYSQYSQYLGLQYSYCSYSQYAQYLGHQLRDYCNTLSTSSTQSIRPRNAASKGSIGKSIEHLTYKHTVPRSSIMPRRTYLQ